MNDELSDKRGVALRKNPGHIWISCIEVNRSRKVVIGRFKHIRHGGQNETTRVAREKGRRPTGVMRRVREKPFRENVDGKRPEGKGGGAKRWGTQKGRRSKKSALLKEQSKER